MATVTSSTSNIPKPPPYSLHKLGTEQEDGLPNLGNTCWFNSLMQSLFKPEGTFKQALLARAQNENEDEHSTRAIRLLFILKNTDRFRNFDAAMAFEKELLEFINDFKIFKNQKFPTNNINGQEDVTEALSALIDYLNLTPLIGGVIPKNCVQVAEIGYQSIAKEPLSYNIVLPKSKFCSLQRSLDNHFNKPEHIADTDGNGLKVENQSYSFTKTAYLSTTTTDLKELIFTIPRFLQDNFGRRMKNNQFIDLEDQVTLILCNDQLIPEKKVTMRLKSAILHFGDLDAKGESAGHYVSLVRDDKRYYNHDSDHCYTYCNDSFSTKRYWHSSKELMALYGYIAIYEVVRTENITIPPPPAKIPVPTPSDPPDVFVDALESQTSLTDSDSEEFLDAKEAL